MEISGEKVWQAWQRAQRLYNDPDNSEAFLSAEQAAHNFAFHESDESIETDLTQEELHNEPQLLVDMYHAALSERDRGLEEDFSRNLAIMSKLVSKTCTIRFIDKYNDLGEAASPLKYYIAERVPIISSGLVPSADLVLAVGGRMQPLIEIEQPEDPLPSFVRARREHEQNIYAYTWDAVRSIVVHNRQARY